MTTAVRLRFVANLALAITGFAGPALAANEPTERARFELGLETVFLEGFEAGECASWSSTSNGPAAADGDDDAFGDASQPVVYCVLPAGLVPDATDCDDSDDTIHPGALELCDSVDNDCDQGIADDGADEPWYGEACDGSGDSDLCTEGATLCVDGQPACDDATGSTVDLCDGQDEDCDPSSPDGSEDPLVGVACDGPQDSDLCLEGTSECSDGSLACSDSTGSTVEVCAGDGADEDCDGLVDEGFDLQTDEQNCGMCGNVCVALNGTNECLSGECTPTCSFGYLSCDGIPENGCEAARNTNPDCVGHTYLGTVSGDTGGGLILDDGFAEAWDRFTLSEDDNGTVYLSASIQLFSPPGVDFDLFVYCLACGGTLAGSSSTHSLSGHTETVPVRAEDDFGASDTHDLLIEIRYFQSNSCSEWQLSITGNTVVAAPTCDP
jgi:hypothetical protein